MKLSDDKLTNAGLTIIGVVALAYFGEKWYDEYNKTEAQKDIATNTSAAQASALISQFRPPWVKILWGIKVNEIMTIAKQITDLNDVDTHYKDLSGGKDSLYDELDYWLTSEQKQEFITYATKGKSGSYFYADKSDKVPVNNWVITIADANVRTTPVLDKNIPLMTNRIKTVPKGFILGATTGKYTYDKIGQVLFVEFWTLTMKGVKKTYFVAKSQIEMVSNDEKKKREKANKIPLQILEGIQPDQTEPTQEIISKQTTTIYNEKFKQVGIAPKHSILGFPIMTLDTGKGKHIKFKTIQGLVRWVKEDQVITRERKI